jgi:hypothetical protein
MTLPVVVLGMHRSGTSFLIRALNLSGLWLGGDEQLHTVEGRARVGNPKGNYESRDAIQINDAILRRSGGAWFRPPPRLDIADEDLARIRTFCGGLVRSQPGDAPRWGWKDPRTVLTLEAWLRALAGPAFVVASFRHPVAVARSLLARDRLPLEGGLALWYHYNVRLLEALEHLPHALVRFDVPPEELVEQVAAVCELTGLRGDRATIRQWHDVDLVRSRVEAADAPALDPRIAAIWETLVARHAAGGERR